MEVSILDVVSVLLLVAILLIPVLHAALVNRQRELRARMATADATPTTTRKRMHDVPRPQKLATTGPQRAPIPSVEERARHGDMAQARATLRSGPAGLRQGIVVATLLAPPRGMSEANAMIPGRNPRPD